MSVGHQPPHHLECVDAKLDLIMRHITFVLIHKTIAGKNSFSISLQDEMTSLKFLRIEVRDLARLYIVNVRNVSSQSALHVI